MAPYKKSKGLAMPHSSLSLYANFLRKDDGDLKCYSKYPHNTYELLITVIGHIHAEAFEKFPPTRTFSGKFWGKSESQNSHPELRTKNSQPKFSWNFWKTSWNFLLGSAFTSPRKMISEFEYSEDIQDWKHWSSAIFSMWVRIKAQGEWGTLSLSPFRAE